MARQHLIRTFVLLFLLLPAVGHSQVVYNKTTGLLSVRSEGQPLTRALAEVSAKTGIEIYISPDADKPVSLNIRNQPVEDTIKEMITPLNNMFLYQGNTSKVKAVKIFVISPSEATTRVGASVAPVASARPDQKRPPTQAELESMGRQRWEQRATPREKEEETARKKKLDEERAAWEARNEAQRAEQEKREQEMQAQEKRMQEALPEASRPTPIKLGAPPDPPLPTFEPTPQPEPEQ